MNNAPTYEIWSSKELVTHTAEDKLNREERQDLPKQCTKMAGRGIHRCPFQCSRRQLHFTGRSNRPRSSGRSSHRPRSSHIDRLRVWGCRRRRGASGQRWRTQPSTSEAPGFSRWRWRTLRGTWRRSSGCWKRTALKPPQGSSEAMRPGCIRRIMDYKDVKGRSWRRGSCVMFVKFESRFQVALMNPRVGKMDL